MARSITRRQHLLDVAVSSGISKHLPLKCSDNNQLHLNWHTSDPVQINQPHYFTFQPSKDVQPKHQHPRWSVDRQTSPIRQCPSPSRTCLQLAKLDSRSEQCIQLSSTTTIRVARVQRLLSDLHSGDKDRN